MAWNSPVTSTGMVPSSVYEFVESAAGTALIVTLNPRELMNITITAQSPTTAEDIEWEILAGQRVSTDRQLDAGTSATILRINTAGDGKSVDDYWKSYYLVMTSGDESGEGRFITDFVASSDVVVLDHALSGTPSVTETYSLYAFDAIQSGTIVFNSTTGPTENNRHHVETVIVGYQFVTVRARVSGTSVDKDLWVTHQTDGVSV